MNVDFYMDDHMTKCRWCQVNPGQYQIDLKKKYGFNLRKWCSNNIELLKNTPLKDRENQLDLIRKIRKITPVTLTPSDDHFRITCDWKCNDKITKKTILSDVFKLFDPLGFMYPITVTSKILLQEMWK